MKNKRKYITLICLECGKEFERYAPNIKYSNGKIKVGPFCSISCATTYRNKNKSYQPKETLSERFFRKITKQENGCWIWNGSKKPQGYGQLNYGGQIYYTHRLSWEIHYGKIHDNLLVLHKCDNRLCCNPEHLFLGYDKDNIKDMIDKNRQNWRECLFGKNHPMAKLCDEEVQAIRLLFNSKRYNIKMLSQMFGINSSHIRRIINGKSWTRI